MVNATRRRHHYHHNYYCYHNHNHHHCHPELQKAYNLAQALFKPKKLAQKMRKSVNIQIRDKTA